MTHAIRVLLTLASLAGMPAAAQPADFSRWPLLTRDFPSTGGGGVRILDYDPVVEGAECRTDFRARMPDGAIFENSVVFDAVPTQGGILCTHGRWQAKDGSARGTTPFQVFMRDGLLRAWPMEE
jgi:hypothetical protein